MDLLNKMRVKILFLTTIIAMVLVLSSGCAKKGLSIENMDFIEIDNQLEITFTAINEGDIGNCIVYVSISKENEVLNNKTIYLGSMEKGKSIPVKDVLDSYPEYTKLDLIGKCE